MTDFTLNATRFWIGLGSVVAQCFLSLIGVVLMPLRGKRAYKYIIQTMAAFAVGALLGNAIIHLIPQAIGVDDHNHGKCGHGDTQTGHIDTELFSNKIYQIFPQTILDANTADLNNKQNISSDIYQHDSNQTLHRHRRQTNLPLNNTVTKPSNALTNHGKQDFAYHTKDHTSLYRMLVTLSAILIFFTYHSLTHQHSHLAHEETLASSVITARRPVTTHSGEISNSAQWADCQQHGKSSQVYPVLAERQPATSMPHQVSKTAEIITADAAIAAESNFCCWSKTFRTISRRAYMVLLGDAIHNFADGVATAAAFAAGNEQGITTSVAIVCHETAHEVGDFAILLHSGMSFSGALFFNFLSSMSAILGYLTGAVIVGSVHQDSFILWILALTAGIFLYIALVDMLPELIVEQNGRFVLFFAQLVAIGAGITVVTVVELAVSH